MLGSMADNRPDPLRGLNLEEDEKETQKRLMKPRAAPMDRGSRHDPFLENDWTPEETPSPAAPFEELGHDDPKPVTQQRERPETPIPIKPDLWEALDEIEPVVDRAGIEDDEARVNWKSSQGGAKDATSPPRTRSRVVGDASSSRRSQRDVNVKAKKFDEIRAIKREIRALPLLGRFFFTRRLSFQNKFWNTAAVSTAFIILAIGILFIGYLMRKSLVGEDPVNNALGVYKPVSIEKIETLLDEYFAVERWEDYLPMIREPEKMRPRMQAWYAQRPLIRPNDIERGDIRMAIRLGRPFVLVDVKVSPNYETRYVAFERVGEDDYKIDWEVAVGYQETPWNLFSISRTRKPKPFRVVVRKGDYYNWQYSDPQIHQCWEMRFPEQLETAIFGYTLLTDPLTEKLEQELAKNRKKKPVAMILNLAYPQSSQDLKQVEIKDFVQRGWVRIDETEAVPDTDPLARAK